MITERTSYIKNNLTLDKVFKETEKLYESL